MPTGKTTNRYPASIAEPGHWEPAPRRVRGVVDGQTVFDTLRARYVWEIPHYPQYYIPREDIAPEYLIDEGHDQKLRRGTARRHGLRVGSVERPGSVRVYGDDADEAVAGTARFDWPALDAWYEEDELIFVHPRNPFTRIDALRSRRRVRVELDGVLLAESDSPIMLFETGLPTRYYLDRNDVVFDHLEHTDTETACPYKGVTSDYWSARIGDSVHDDVAWSYRFPTQQVAPIAGLIAFYNEKVTLTID